LAGAFSSARALNRSSIERVRCAVAPPYVRRRKLEPRHVAPDRHLRDAELGGELGDVDRLMLGDLLEDPVSTIYGLHGPILSEPLPQTHFISARSIVN
jgi:hypothetical protein